jgi:uncharacterized membrane protein YhiD involved in acid resistance
MPVIVEGPEYHWFNPEDFRQRKFVKLLWESMGTKAKYLNEFVFSDKVNKFSADITDRSKAEKLMSELEDELDFIIHYDQAVEFIPKGTSKATGIRDTGRVAAQIVTGIGFIGAGTVLRNGPIVLGLTTAATLWLAASIGMACGAGMFDIAFAGTCLAVLTLVIVRIFERKVFPNSIKRTRRIRISLICTPEEVDIVQDFLLEKYKNLIELTKKPQVGDPPSVKLTCVVDIPEQKTIKELYKTFQNQDGIISVSIREFSEA